MEGLPVIGIRDKQVEAIDQVAEGVLRIGARVYGAMAKLRQEERVQERAAVAQDDAGVLQPAEAGGDMATIRRPTIGKVNSMQG